MTSWPSTTTFTSTFGRRETESGVFLGGLVSPMVKLYSTGTCPSASVARGMFSSRPNDTFGLGYYYTAPSDIPLLRAVGVDDEQGVEAWYNFEITPWLHVTADLQVIDPGLESTPLREGADTAWVLGVRTRVNF